MRKRARWVPILLCALMTACGGREKAAPASGGASAPAAAAESTPAAALPSDACPSDGTWHECSVLKRLEQSGMGVHRDSQPAREPGIAQPGMLLHIGRSSLAVFLFPDSGTRRAAERSIDTTKFVRYDQAQTIRAERSLIRAANLIAILDSQRDAQRERVGDALTAGPPQPHRP